jgi:hypothetical protein
MMIDKKMMILKQYTLLLKDDVFYDHTVLKVVIICPSANRGKYRAEGLSGL